MLETQTQTEEKEFTNGFIPGVSVIVDEENIAKIDMRTWPQGLEYNQEQITEMISLLVEVHDYMEHQKEDDTMPLFDDIEDVVEEIVIDESTELNIEQNEYDEIASNATAFLYMKEDHSKERISQIEMMQALHILRDSIDSYLNSLNGNEEEQQQPAGE